ncbi:polysaccharide biosynthesis tyrosine autokinase [Scytonema hofmannii FACHB-248]|uniref:Polysaccharide biosynthesis tyrosine autokinase n=1 Tax=Scytonema hofmannii FACHB-248 TaxID=1842502 RepID=A0ABR8GP55_9CYAN|nr:MULTISPECIES: polysaccharide biosynthesis tyrosine autokinase [Nostocales]MBD2604543.1 polysaccharide biosynthesis tyrosine autokinase [Scytonema hofmannii FACHB-248]
MANTGLNQGQLITTSPQSAVNIRQLSTILFRRCFLILGVSGLVMSVAIFLATIAKPKYQSSMQLLVNSNLYEGLQSRNIQGNTNSQFTDQNFQFVDYTAQLRLMLSTKLIQKAVDLLRPEYPDIKVEDILGKKGKQAKPGSLVVSQLEAETGVNKVPSQVFEITFKDQDPIKAVKVLQALKKVYQDYNIEQQKQRLNKGLSFVNDRLPKIKQEVIKSENNLKRFRQKHNLLDPEAQSKILLDSLANTQKQLESTHAQLQDVRARYNNLQLKMAASPQNALISSRLSQSTRYQTLLNEIQKTELALAQERLRYTDTSPAIAKLTQQRSNQVSLLRQEIERTVPDKASTTPQSGKSLLTQGQMGEVDLKLLEELIEVQTTSVGLVANEQSLAKSEQQLRSELSKYPTLIAEYNRLLPEIETNRKTLEQLLQAQQSLGLKIAQEGFDWQVLEEPQPGIYMGSGRTLRLVGGAIIGPILGIAIALIWEMSKNAIYSSQELQNLTNLRLLGRVPKLSLSLRKKRLSSLFLRKGSLSSAYRDKQLSVYTQLPSHETFDMIYQNIQISNPYAFKSLMVTSALPKEGKTTIAQGLALSAARMHRRVLLIDANMRDPSLHNILELSNDWGLSLLLLDETNNGVPDYIQPIHPAIDILTAGPTPEDTVKLLSSRRMKELIQVFEQTYDLVLIDAPTILGTVDARILATYCHQIVLVEKMGQVTRTELIQATEILGKLNVVGIIANEPNNSAKA